MHYVYVIKSFSTDKIYIGFTSDLKRRITEHNNKKGGKYTKNKGPFKLVYYEAYRSAEDAKRREDNLKLHKKAYGQLKGRIVKSFNEP